MLRESNQTNNAAFDLTEITAGVTGAGDIPAAALLAAFTEAAVTRDSAALAEHRTALRRELGPAALVDAAATVAAFHGFVRLADATGIPYEGAGFGTDTTELRAAIGLENFYASALADRGAGGG
jgi:alkylhydroperoxidase family enzyme